MLHHGRRHRAKIHPGVVERPLRRCHADVSSSESQNRAEVCCASIETVGHDTVGVWDIHEEGQEEQTGWEGFGDLCVRR